MADYKVGNLQIVFDAVDETSKSFDNLAKNLNAVKKAISNIGNLGESDLKKFGDNLDKIREKFSPLLTEINGASTALTSFNEVTKRLGINKVADVARAFKDLQNNSEAAQKAIPDLGGRISGGAKELNKTVKEVTKNFNNLTTVSTPLWERNKTAVDKLNIGINSLIQRLRRLNTEEQDTQEEQNKTEKSTKKSTGAFGKLFASLKRIALYRLIRSALKAITSSLTETAKAFAQVDDGVNDTMSQLTSSLSIIKLSFGATLLPILQMITPIIQEIGVAFARMANMVSQAMSTTGTYTKINTDYIKNYRDELEKTGSLLDFDKFRALSGGKGGLGDFLIPNQEVDEKNEKIIQLRGTIERTTSIISSLWDIIKAGWHSIEPFVDDILDIVQDLVIPALKKVFEIIGEITKKIDELGLTKPILYGIMVLLIGLGAVKIINGILSLTSAINGLNVGLGLLGIAFIGAFAIAEKWGDMTWWQRLIGIVGVATVAILGLAVAMGAFQSAWSLGAAAVGIIAGITAIVAALSTAKNEVSKPVGGGGRARGYANGGIPTVGTMFWAGEAGAETVTVGSSGRTEVTNVQQMEQALYNALVRFSNQNRGTDGGAININIDGQKVFEVTRRTAQKKGLDFIKV